MESSTRTKNGRSPVGFQNETKFHNRKEEQYKYPFLSVRKKGHGPKDKLKYAKHLLSLQPKMKFDFLLSIVVDS